MYCAFADKDVELTVTDTIKIPNNFKTLRLCSNHFQCKMCGRIPAILARIYNYLCTFYINS